MSLREEIYSIISHSMPHNNPNPITFVTNKILGIIEKRIDSKLSLISETDIRNSEYHYGVYRILKDMKEMLK